MCRQVSESWGRELEAIGLREKVCFRVLFESLHGRGTADVGGLLLIASKARQNERTITGNGCLQPFCLCWPQKTSGLCWPNPNVRNNRLKVFVVLKYIDFRAVPLSNSKGGEGWSPRIPSPFPESASVQTSPKGITHSSKRCDIYCGDQSKVKSIDKTKWPPEAQNHRKCT